MASAAPAAGVGTGRGGRSRKGQETKNKRAFKKVVAAGEEPGVIGYHASKERYACSLPMDGYAGGVQKSGVCGSGAAVTEQTHHAIADRNTGMINSEQKQIIAIGGSGSLTDAQTRELDHYVIRQARTKNPAVCFVPTANGDADASLLRFYTIFSQLPCRLSHLVFFRRTPADLRSLLLQQDVIYVGGGNTRSMLAVWREWGMPEILKEAWESGVVLAGRSAGAICWFVQGVTDSVADVLLPLDCLGFLPGSCCPHYDGEADRRPAYHRMLLEQKIIPGIAIDDGVGVHFRGTEPYRVVTPREKATAYRVQVMNEIAQEEPLQVEIERLRV